MSVFNGFSSYIYISIGYNWTTLDYFFYCILGVLSSKAGVFVDVSGLLDPVMVYKLYSEEYRWAIETGKGFLGTGGIFIIFVLLSLRSNKLSFFTSITFSFSYAPKTLSFFLSKVLLSENSLRYS